MGYLDKLKTKWNLKSGWQLVIILIVFACTGTTVLYLKVPYNEWLEANGGKTTLTTALYWLCIWPVYNIILLCYGFLFGQFAFFWAYERKTMGRIFKKRKNKKTANETE